MRIVFVVLLVACVPTRVPRPAVEGEPTLTVVTWNVNYGLAWSSEDLDEATRGADVVLLQETNAAWEMRLSERLRDRFPHQAWLDDAAAGGQAVLSKRPFTHQVLPAEHGWFPAMRVEVDGVQILNVHLHPPIAENGSLVSGYFGTGPTRRRELTGFFASLDSSLPTLIVGDFNEGTSGDAISWSADRKFRSALPEFTPNAKTWHWPVTKSLELTAQFDHVLYGPGLEPLSAEVLNLGRSDHFPVRAVFTRGHFKLTPRPHGGSMSLTSQR
ncbi:MAG: endonuclease/exonuclease/phosphatase family protein [Archangium sp.]